ncbi:type II toxin-antitoxin system RelE/ParE family toxin [Microvirga tunisiensis]|uniref:Type II toxin-antitoxin system RelE/ParE family toxin n=2 Tax=Pannonibacter tanglangensis TaxID=2750084 RepID=A0ABW9ZQV2_9HYPH|nr:MULTISPECIES: type II toxin-antitoxin system RelE/ParE family toxin [unclassified Pannonibacter]NBN65339.1 type II toxin-antitoxin system RelE/ParE family toxin [Pannonibacter sp. XCT-34]NBN79684.1 type II toxin-antitoxin system RelE/ParE family toxin [Pannonibacter sp. XCT-53]
MIQSYRNKQTEAVARGKAGKGFPPDLVNRAQKLLAVLNAAVRLEDLRLPPGNRLHRLSGDRQGQHALAINDQWRICFVWTEIGPSDVEICDYH